MTTHSSITRDRSLRTASGNVHIMPSSGDGPAAADRLALRRVETLHEALALRSDELETRVSSLEPRAGMLEELGRSLSERVTGLKESFTALLGRTDRAEVRLDDLTTHGDSLDARTVRIRQEMDELARRTAVSESRQQRTDGRLSRLERMSDAANLRARRMELRQDGADYRLDSLDNAVGALGRTSADHGTQIAGLGSRLGLAESAHKALREAHNRLSAQASRLDVRTTALSLRFRRTAAIAGGALLTVAIVAGAALWMSVRSGADVGASQGQASALPVPGSGDPVGRMAEPTALPADNRVTVATGVDVPPLANTVLARDLQSVSDRLSAVDSRLSSDVAGIKARLYAGDETATSPVDLAQVKSDTWLRAQPAGHYVVQLAGVYRRQDLSNLLGRLQKTLPQDRLSYFQTLHRGRDWFVVLFGSFQTFDQAMQALDALPESLRRTGPYIRTFGGVARSMDRADRVGT